MLENMVPPVKKPVGCKVMKIAETLGESDGKLLVEYVNDPAWVAEQLVSALHERGVFIGAMSVRKHRAGLCMCKKVQDA
jgi:hypothetical protein